MAISGRKHHGVWPGILLIALATMGSDGTCVNQTGPYDYGHGQGGHGGSPSQQFFAPSVGGNRVDWCLHWGAQCGEPAASAFCQRVGYDRASAWTIARNIGAQGPTVVLGNGALCANAGCDGFDSVTCVRGAAGGPAGGSSGDSFTYEPNTNRPGADYNSVVLQQADPRQCKKLCRQDPACRAYTYVPPGVQMPGNAVCWLKNHVPAPMPAGGHVSGVKR